MKKMKKILASVLAATMAASMSFTAFAATTDSETGKFVDETEITITKVYTATNEGTTSPAEDLTFEVEKVKVEDAGVDPDTKKVVTVDDMPMISVKDATSDDDTVVGIELGAGNATVQGTESTLTIELPEYKAVGVYTYTVIEKSNNLAGVTYYTNPITVVVTVIQGDDSQVRVAAVHAELEGENKTDKFENTYSAGSLAVTKTVTGNLGDQNKVFEVLVTFTAPEGKTVNEAISYEDDGEIKTISADDMKDGFEKVTITVKNEETVTFTNIPYGVTYTVVEKDYSADGYETSYSFTTGNLVPGTYGNGVAPVFEVKEAEHEMGITNNKGTTVDTGISLDSLPYILLLAAAALGMFAVVAKKRDKDLF